MLEPVEGRNGPAGYSSHSPMYVDDLIHNVCFRFTVFPLLSASLRVCVVLRYPYSLMSCGYAIWSTRTLVLLRVLTCGSTPRIFLYSPDAYLSVLSCHHCLEDLSDPTTAVMMVTDRLLHCALR